MLQRIKYIAALIILLSYAIILGHEFIHHHHTDGDIHCIDCCNHEDNEHLIDDCCSSNEKPSQKTNDCVLCQAIFDFDFFRVEKYAKVVIQARNNIEDTIVKSSDITNYLKSLENTLLKNILFKQPTSKIIEGIVHTFGSRAPPQG